MNTYEIERIDRNGNPLDVQTVTADTFSIEANGTLWFYDSKKSDGHSPAGVILVFAPGAWGQVLLLDETAANSKANTVTHPVATADEIDKAIQGATITTTAEGGDDLPGAWRYATETIKGALTN